MQVIKTEVFQFDELGESAKEKARQWWRGLIDGDDISRNVIPMAEEVAPLLGVEFTTHTVRLMGGSSWQAPDIYWTGFSSQGDGACFEGRYRSTGKAEEMLRASEYNIEELQQIAVQLDKVHSMVPVDVQIKTHGSYYHSGMMEFAFDWDSWTEWIEEGEPLVEKALRNFADWIYKMLSEENDYVNSDEQIDEMLRDNEYTFTAEGKRFG